MKTFIIALLVLVILITGILTYCSYLRSVEDDLMMIIENISLEIHRNDWEKSKKNYELLDKKWDSSEKILAMFNDHGELDEIKLVIGDLKESISCENLEHALKSITEIEILLERLKKNESLTLENIL